MQKQLLEKLLKELEDYQKVEMPQALKEKEIRSICRAIQLVAFEMIQNKNYQVTDEQQKNIEWCYNYLMITN